MKICSSCNCKVCDSDFYKGYSICKVCHSQRKVRNFLDDFSLEIIRCKYCRCVINDGVDKRWKIKSYCSEWCWEEDCPPTIKHPCIKCGNATNPIIVKTGCKKGKQSGAYYKLCEECI